MLNYIQHWLGSHLTSFPQVFEELVIMNSAWGPEFNDVAAWSAALVEEISLFDFEEMLADEVECTEWDNELGRGFFD
ncbi:hypothetical protein H0H81_000711 [Sphagnurus paluster]|uniref:Uncharacterized protein n=1 Tax=Sphagnurus paluster TaxID=117069 RepID=A0A9P7FMT4_9AGAR|nr:hypothetical protein H0H81_000711 [Sphagnurus paluster]